MALSSPTLLLVEVICNVNCTTLNVTYFIIMSTRAMSYSNFDVAKVNATVDLLGIETLIDTPILSNILLLLHAQILSVLKAWVSEMPRAPSVSTETVAHGTISCDCG